MQLETEGGKDPTYQDQACGRTHCDVTEEKPNPTHTYYNLCMFKLLEKSTQSPSAFDFLIQTV